MKLYHISPSSNKDSISVSGLQRGNKSPTEKKMGEDSQHQPTEVKAQHKFNEILADARRHVNSEYPSHEDSIFFWSSRKTAESASSEISGSQVLARVDSDNLPDDCKCVVGSHRDAADIFWETADLFEFGGGIEQERELFDRSVDFWEDVCELDDPGCEVENWSEIWCGCDIPEDRIEFIEGVN